MRLALSLAVLAALPSLAAAQDTSARSVRRIPGAVCMSAIETEQTRQGNLPPAYAEPRRGSEVVGRVGSVVIAMADQQSGGFTYVMLPNGRMGWVDDRWLTRWSVPGQPRATCEPRLLSNGRVGFHAELPR